MKRRPLVGAVVWLTALAAYSFLFDYSDPLRSMGLMLAGYVASTGVSLLLGTNFGADE